MTRDKAGNRLRGTSTARQRTPEGRAAQAAAGRASLPAMLAANKSRRVDSDEIAGQVAALIAAAEIELGGEDSLSVRQKCLLVNQRVLLTAVLSASTYLSKAGVVGAHGRVRPILATLGSFISGLRLNTDSLGLPGALSGGASPNDPDAVIAEIRAARGVSA